MQAGVKGLAENHQKWIGRVADFAGFEVFKSGSMRSAQFVRWRDDLEPTDCLLGGEQ
jgi:hypothetical protein